MDNDLEVGAIAGFFFGTGLTMVVMSIFLNFCGAI